MKIINNIKEFNINNNGESYIKDINCCIGIYEHSMTITNLRNAGKQKEKVERFHVNQLDLMNSELRHILYFLEYEYLHNYNELKKELLECVKYNNDISYYITQINGDDVFTPFLEEKNKRKTKTEKIKKYLLTNIIINVFKKGEYTIIQKKVKTKEFKEWFSKYNITIDTASQEYISFMDKEFFDYEIIRAYTDEDEKFPTYEKKVRDDELKIMRKLFDTIKNI